MNNPKKLCGLILTGGFSRRMGQDKALLNYHGKPQIEYIFDLLNICCSNVFLSKRADQETYQTFSFIDDEKEFTGKGPLGGILSAMKLHPGASWLVMACDLPFVTEETLQTLINNRDFSKIATAFKSNYDGLPEPLCAIWEGHAYKQILDYFNQGIHCPRKVLINSDCKILKQRNPHWLDNVNDLKEFDEAISVFKKH